MKNEGWIKMKNNQKDIVQADTEKLIKIRNGFYEYLDTHIPKKDGQFDFSSSPKLDAKDIYALFYKLDYQARKLRGHLVKAYDLKAE